MSEIATIVRWEWFKLRRRWMPWVVLAVLVLVSQLSVWGSYIAYRNTGRSTVSSSTAGDAVQIACQRLLDPNFQPPQGADPNVIEQLRTACRQNENSKLSTLRDLRRGFEAPGSIPNSLQVMHMIAVVCLGVMTASALGTEYGAGTLRTVLARGTGRGQFLAGKFALLALYLAAALAILIAAVVISSEIARALAPVPLAGEEPAATWSDAAAAAGKSWFSMMPYLALTGLVTIVIRSSAPAIAVGVGYVIGEQVLVAIFNEVFPWFYRVGNLLPGHNMALWTNAGAFGRSPEHAPSGFHIFVVLAVYLLIFGAIAFRLFLRRDVSGATGS